MKNKAELLWAYKVNTPLESEVVQRIAFSFGYKWVEPGTEFNKPTRLNEPYLVFSDIFTLTYCPTVGTLDEEDVPIVTNISAALEFFKNPPLKKVVEEKDKDKVEKFPRVSFSYRKNNGGEEYYLIAVVTYNQGTGYLEGLDMNEGNQFKRFLLKNIIGNIIFLGFSESKQ